MNARSSSSGSAEVSGVAPVVVLGGGFIGQAFASAFRDAFPRAPLVLSRRDGRRLQGDPEGLDVVPFRLEDPSTWELVPKGARAVVWTFPAGEGAKEFFLSRLLGRPTCVLSTTSCYLVPEPGSNIRAATALTGNAAELMEVDEATPLDLQKPRFVAEEQLRQQGATVLALSGLFGGERQPDAWLKRGLIRSLQGHVNLVHRDDVVRALLAWCANPRVSQGERLNLSTQTHPWSALVNAFLRDGRLPPGFTLSEPPSNGPLQGPLPAPSKRVLAKRIVERYPELLAKPFVNVLERGPQTS